MARDASGVYTLPSSVNPVAGGTPITPDWANTTLNDIKAELTDSLSRSGKGAMTVPLKVADGTAAAPAYTFSDDTDSGLYRAGANDVRMSVGGSSRVRFGTTALTIETALAAADGTVGAPGVAFANDLDCGLYRIGANRMGLAVAGALSIDVATAGVTFGSPILANDGEVGAPGVAFAGDTDTGLYLANDADVRLAVGGADQLTATSSGVTLAAGSTVTAPTPLIVGSTGVAFENSWATGASTAPRYWKDAVGCVHLSGAATRAAAENTVAFTLPSGYRPIASRRFAIIDDSAVVTYVTITTSGQVFINSLASGRVEYLDGIVFETF